jgi:hypothetical protein
LICTRASFDMRQADQSTYPLSRIHSQDQALPYSDRLPHFRITPLVGAIAASSACGKIPDAGGDDDGSGADAGADGPMADPCLDPNRDLSIDEAFDCFVRLQCQFASVCLGRGDVDGCIAELTSQPGFTAERQRTIDAIDAGRRHLSQQGAHECLQALHDVIAQQQCGDLEISACDLVIVGEVPAGGSCYERQDCTPRGSDCEPSAPCVEQCCVGVCQPPSPIGGVCDGDCVEGAHCVFQGGQGICVSGDPGSPCSDDFACDDELHCEGGTCKPDLGVAASCTRDAMCAEPLICYGDVGGNVGQCSKASDVGDRCDNRCTDPRLYCPSSGQCAMVPSTVGASCVDAGRCLGGLSCIAGKCAVRPTEGQVCAPYDCVPPTYCSAEVSGGATGTCVQPAADGSMCQQSDHCQSGVCSSAGIVPSCVAYESCP